MGKKAKKIGDWKVGDKVFELPKWQQELRGTSGNPTPEYWIIVSFNSNRTMAHIRYNPYGTLSWVRVDRLRHYGNPMSDYDEDNHRWYSEGE